MNCFEILGIASTKDKKIIRHAYASQAKKYHLETDTEEVERLKDAYDRAMAYAREVSEYMDFDYTDALDIPEEIEWDEAEEDEDYTDILNTSGEKGNQEEKNIFYKSESLWENYEKIHYKKAKELSGVQKLKEDIEEGHNFSFAEAKEYVMSEEFLHNQYEEFYIHALLELFEKYEGNLEELFLPFAFMYGWNNNDQLCQYESGEEENIFLESHSGQEIRDFIYERLFGLNISPLLEKEEVVAFSVNAQRYHALSIAYKEKDIKKQDFFWRSLWQYGLNHDELPVVKVKNDFSFWSMLKIFLETHKELNFEVYQNLEQTFHLSTQSNSSKRHIFQPIVDIIEKNAGDSIFFMNTGENQIVEFRKKAHLSRYLEENKLDYSSFVYFYELYYFVPERNEEEQKVMDLLQNYTQYEEYYWQQAEQMFEEEEEMEMEQQLLKIMECVTDGNKELMKELEECILNTADYYKNHQEVFEERDIVEEEEKEDEELIRWIALVDILEREGYVAERDWKDYKEDFLYYIGNLNGIKSKGLKIDSDWLDEDGEITEWLEIIDEKWEKEGMAMFAFDIDSDSYVLFPCAIEKFEQLEEWAEEAGFRIAYGKDM